MRTGTNGIELIKHFEGFRPKMYKDAVGLPTIGYGTLIDTAAEQWLKTATITPAQAEELLRKDLVAIERNLNLMVPVGITQNQYDALASFAYNLGIGALKSSTLLKKVRANAKDPSIRAEFLKWVHAGGKVLAGLQRRRGAEADLYFSI